MIAEVHDALLAALVAEIAAAGRPDFAETQVGWGSAGGVCVGLGADCDGDGTLTVGLDPLGPMTAQNQTRGQSVQWCNVRTQVSTVIEVMRSYPQPEGGPTMRLAVGDDVTAAAAGLSDDLEVIWNWLVDNQADPSWLSVPTPGVGVTIGEPEMIEPGGGCAGFAIRVGWHLRTR